MPVSTTPCGPGFISGLDRRGASTVVAASGLTMLDRPPYPGNATGLDGYVTNMSRCRPIGGGAWRGS